MNEDVSRCLEIGFILDLLLRIYLPSPIEMLKNERMLQKSLKNIFTPVAQGQGRRQCGMDYQDDEHKAEGLEAATQALTSNEVAELVRTHTDWMLGAAFRILRDRAHAEDAVQVAFTKIWSKIHAFEGRSALQTWMHRVVVNEALMILRKIKRRNESSIDHLLPVFDESGYRVEVEDKSAATPEVLLSRRQTHTYVRDAIMALPDKYRLVLCLRDIEGFSTAETSKALELSEANVKVRLHRARSALKTLLEPHIKDQKL
ncbi:sigma-70 family RNA polymerase sigma factor [Sulfitobacter sp.]|uniref:RNA polymerase sigma factor n=1 Tax=Sulfitobacter sp. TaxID=1903071 RepID=UPI0032979642